LTLLIWHSTCLFISLDSGRKSILGAWNLTFSTISDIPTWNSENLFLEEVSANFFYQGGKGGMAGMTSVPGRKLGGKWLEIQKLKSHPQVASPSQPIWLYW
jgi:hypothetical protein